METHAVNTDVPALARLQQRALIVGIIGLLAGAAGAVMNIDQFFRAWLIGFLFCLGMTLGPLSLLMMQHLSGGHWGLVGRRIFEAATRTLPFVILLFVPLLFNLPAVYHWTAPGAAAADEIIQKKSLYLNVPFFIGRAVLYFAVWMLLTYKLNRYSDRQDRGEAGVTPADTRQVRVVSAPGLLVYSLTGTFASIDWIMSIDVHWFSTIFGLIFIVGQALTGFALTIAVLALLVRVEPIATYVTSRHFHDLGKLLLTFVMLWAYMAFSQYLITWGGNLPEELIWYAQRTRGSWGYVALIVAFGNFVIPFTLLLSRDLKERPGLLSKLAIGLIIMSLIDLIWMVSPSYNPQPQGFPVPWMDIAIPIGLGGIWVWLFIRQLRSRSLLPLNDPFFKEAFAHEAH